MDDYEASLRSIETLLEDPAVKAIVDTARESNNAIAEFPMSPTEATRAMWELNDAWERAGLKNETMNFTGRAWLMNVPRGHVREQEVSAEYYLQAINQKIIVSGFSMLEATHLGENGIDTKQEIYLNGKTLIKDITGAGKRSFVDVIASINPVESTLIYDGISGERAGKWLDFYYPDYKQYIDEACSHASNDAERVMNLWDFTVPVSGTNKETVKELAAHLNVYLKDTVNLESHIPYFVTLADTIYTLEFDEKGKKRYMPLRRPIAAPVFLSAAELVWKRRKGQDYLEPMIQGAIIDADRKNLISCRVPFSSIENIDSLRTMAESQQQ